jgi:hypothetical protein
MSITSGGTGPRGCELEPVVARLEVPGDDVTSVVFRAGRKATAEDTVPPYEAVLPYGALRRELPKRAEVIGQAVFHDGRRVAVPAKLRACPRR